MPKRYGFGVKQLLDWRSYGVAMYLEIPVAYHITEARKGLLLMGNLRLIVANIADYRLIVAIMNN